jgi:hypothetical protein
MEIKQMKITTTNACCSPQSTVAISDDFLATVEGLGIGEEHFQDIAQRSSAVERITETLLLVIHVGVLLLSHIFVGRQVSHAQAEVISQQPLKHQTHACRINEEKPIPHGYGRPEVKIYRCNHIASISDRVQDKKANEKLVIVSA